MCTPRPLQGYALFGHCIVMLITSLVHPSHFFFNLLVLLLALPSALRVALFLAAKTREKGHKIALVGAVLVLHLGYLLYLHFGFHVVVEGKGKGARSKPDFLQSLGYQPRLILAHSKIPSLDLEGYRRSSIRIAARWVLPVEPSL